MMFFYAMWSKFENSKINFFDVTLENSIPSARHKVWRLETNLSGMIKCSNDHSSFNEFCNGVPVISSRKFVLKSTRVLYSSESSFFKRWASSTRRAAQYTEPSSSWNQREPLILRREGQGREYTEERIPRGEGCG